MATIIIGALLLGAVALAIRSLRKNKGGCSCGCDGCSQAKQCGSSQVK